MSRKAPSRVLPILTVTDVRPSRVLPTSHIREYVPSPAVGPTLPHPNAPLLRSRNVSITYGFHYKNLCAIYGFDYKSFISLLNSPSRFSQLLTKRSPIRKVLSPNFPRSRAPIRQPCVTHSTLRTRNIWLLVVFLIHKHSISLQLFRN